jgi:hypothetical protein
VQFGDPVRCFRDVLSDGAQRIEIDFGVSPHASCWQITALWR